MNLGIHKNMKCSLMTAISICLLFSLDVSAKEVQTVKVEQELLLNKKNARKKRNKGDREARDRGRRGNDQGQRGGDSRNRDQVEKERQRRDRDQARRDKERRDRDRDQARRDKERRDRDQARRDKERRDRDRDQARRDKERRDRDQARRDKERRDRDQARRDKERRDRDQARRDKERRDRDQARRDKDRRDRDQARRDKERRDRDQARRDKERRDRDQARRDKERRDRDQARRDKERRDRDRARKNKDRAERDRIKKDRRKNARRNDRIRDKDRRKHRRVSRDRYKKHKRYHRPHRRVVRYHYRWSKRYDRWWKNHRRWGHPGWPNDRISYPSPWPDGSHLWSIYKIINVADNLETGLEHLYNSIYSEFGFDESHHDQRASEISSLAYDLWHAAQVYSDAVEFFSSNLCYSIYELYNLEEKAEKLERAMNRMGVSRHIRSHFNVSKYYINELLWQYRKQLGPIDTWRDLIDEGDDWRYGNDSWDDISNSYQSTTLYFWWSQPHYRARWDVAYNTVFDVINIEATETFGMRGKNGVAGVTHVILHYTDGSELDLVNQSHEKYSPRTGQIVLTDQGDHFSLYNPYPHLPVSHIELQSDSWIAQDIDVGLSISIE